ncbi:TPA: glycosyltransferase, partial [Escherichia coli]|nr:glycosyltransferase [Escherichia coli]
YISSVSIDLDVKKIKPPVFFNAVDSFSKFNYREWQVSGKLYSRVKYYLYKNYERYILNYVDAFNLVSKKDKEFMCAIHKNNINKITNINIGVDSSRFHCKSECGYSQEDKKTFNILFLGNFDYNPNADAARFLCNEIYPSLQSMYMDVKVYIVGKNPPNDLLDSKNIIRTGFVSDVSVYYRMATVFICPLKLGAGMKNKILEAMATGLPIISSDVGVEGIDGLTDGENYLRANTLHEYVDAITRVHNNPLLGDGLGRKAAKLISEKYDWQNIVDRYVTKLQDISDTQ